MNGTVDSITTDWRGDTLAAAVISADTEIAVRDTADFDEDGGWITIADAAPIEYLTVDEDFDTITLAAAVGAAYEVGDPVVVWDPTVLPEGAKVVEYVASVMTDRGAVPATIPHAVVPLSGVDRLLGASVSIDEEDDGDWYVAQVYGRESSVDPAYVGNPFLALYLPSNTGIPNSTVTAVTGLVPSVQRGFDDMDGSGWVTIPKTGNYTVTATAMFTANGTGQRNVRVTKRDLAGVESDARLISVDPVNGSRTAFQATVPLPLQAGEAVRMKVFQSSTASLDLMGVDVNGAASGLDIVWGSP